MRNSTVEAEIQLQAIQVAHQIFSNLLNPMFSLWSGNLLSLDSQSHPPIFIRPYRLRSQDVITCSSFCSYSAATKISATLSSRVVRERAQNIHFDSSVR